MNAIWIVLPILTLLMFELGLTLRIEDFKLFRQRPRPIIAGLIGQILFLPVLAFMLGYAFRLEPLFFIGIMLIACSPGGSSSNIFSRCSLIRIADCAQQHYYAVYNSRRHGIFHSPHRKPSEYRYKLTGRKPHRTKPSVDASPYYYRCFGKKILSAKSRKHS